MLRDSSDGGGQGVRSYDGKCRVCVLLAGHVPFKDNREHARS